VRLLFLLAALHDVDVLAYDIQNAYIDTATKEKSWFHGGDEMGSDKGKVNGIDAEEKYDIISSVIHDVILQKLALVRRTMSA
jgi:hypothetical protein